MSQHPTTPPQKSAATTFLSADPTGSLKKPSSDKSSASSVSSEIDSVFDSPTPKGRPQGVEQAPTVSAPSTPGLVSPSAKAWPRGHNQDVYERHDETGVTEKSFDGEPQKKKLLAENPFENEHSRTLFEAIDQLQSWGASKFVKTPELVIVGMQSSGKSSLLRTLTQVPFPVKAGCCTRFPTRIVSQHTPPGTPNHFRITIEEPGVKADKLSPADDEASKYVLEGETLTEEVFGEEIEKIRKDYMGIGDKRGKKTKNFVANVLVVKLSGPNYSDFSVLDLPGIFASAHHVTKDEMTGVKNMVIEYMKEKENIVICVADGSVDLENQEIFTLVLDHVEPERRVGVFTKCDIPGADERVSEEIIGQTGNDQRMPNGWFVVQNYAKDSKTISKTLDLVSEEELFSAPSWSDIIPSARRGSTALRTYLGEQLSSKIREAFPAIKATIESKLSRYITEQSELGKPLESISDRRTYLIELLRKFNSKADAALTQPGLLGNENMELRKAVRKLNDEYDAFMRTSGHLWEFKDDGVDPRAKLSQAIRHQPVSQAPELTMAAAQKPNIAFQHLPKPKTPEALYKDIRDELTSLSTTQLPGVINHNVYPKIYHRQASKWTAISQFHLQRAGDAVKLCMEGLLESICPGQGPMNILRQELDEVAKRMYEHTFEKAKENLEVYCLSETKPKFLQTSNPGFEKQVLQWRRLRYYEGLCQANGRTTERDGMDYFDLMFSQTHPSIQENMSQDVHDVLKAYYQLTLESFIRHVTNTIVEDFVSHKDGPLRALSEHYIFGLSEEEINRLTREDDVTAQRREEVEENIAKLRGARAIADKATERTRGLSLL